LSHSLFFIYACAHLRRPTRDGETLHIPLKHNMRSTVESRPDKPWSLVLVWSLRYKNCTDSMNTSSSEHMELQLGRRLGSAVFSGLSCGRGKLSYLSSYLIFTQLSVSLLEHDCKCDILYEVLLASQVLPKFFPRSGVQVGAPRDPIFCWADANSYRIRSTL
jgi:hypothetical protein